MEAAEWYKVRNDRTNRINKVILDSSAKTIKVIVNAPEELSNQVMALVMANTLTRWCRRVTFEVPKTTPCIVKSQMGQSLTKVLYETMVTADPFGDFHVFEKHPTGYCDFVVNIGDKSIAKGKKCYWIDSDGWISGFGYGVKSNPFINNVDYYNPVGAIFAVSCINSLVFSEYIGLAQSSNFERWISLFDFSNSSNPYLLQNPALYRLPDFGKVWQIGAGAVGSSFDFMLSLMQLQGAIRIIDFDKASVPNTSSSLVFTAKDAFDCVKKVDACKKVLKANDSFSVSTHISDYSSFIAKGYLENEYPDCILCFANEKNVWSTIQNNEPPIVLHATTSINWGVNFGRHIPFKDWCIVCRFGVKGYKFTPTCAKGVAKTDAIDEENLGTLPFLPPVAAALVLAELLKMDQFKNNGYPMNPNFVQLSMIGIESSEFIGLQQNPSVSCPVCSNQEKDHYHKGYPKSKYYL